MTLWVADAVVAWLVPATPPGRAQVRLDAARRAGVTVDERSMLQVVRDLRRGGSEVLPTAYMGNYWIPRPFFRDTLYPVAGVSAVASVMCNERAPVLYQADERGFTNPTGQWRAPAELALVGDSYVMGWCVPASESFAARIRAGHPATIVLGFGASGPLTQLAQVREYLPPLHPARVLWFYHEGNDLLDLAREKTQPILRRYLDTAFTQHLAERQPEIDARLRTFTAASERAAEADTNAAPRESAARRVVNILKLWHLRSRLLRREAPETAPACCDLALFEDVAREVRRTVASWGGRLTVVYLPSQARLTQRNQGPGERSADSVLAALRRLDVPVFDLRPLLPAQGSARDLYVYEGAHFTPRGHQAVATLVAGYLDSAGVQR